MMFYCFLLSRKNNRILDEQVYRLNIQIFFDGMRSEQIGTRVI